MFFRGLLARPAHFAPREIVVLDHLTADGSLDAGLRVEALPPVQGPEDLGGRPFLRVDLQA